MQKYSDFERVNDNLWKNNGHRYRLTARGVTPNSCWLINAVMVELIDIDIATGKDIYGDEHYDLENGTVQAGPQFIKEAAPGATAQNARREYLPEIERVILVTD